MISNCNCPEKVECGCDPYFDDYDSGLVSVLSVGNLVSDSCTFKDYVIDWYKDGVWYMASAHADNTEPGIDAYHPFIDAAAIPVIAGTYTAAIRYVVLDSSSDKVFSEPKLCQKWCDDLSGLPEIEVGGIDCSSTNSARTGYNYKLLYNTSQDYSLATRQVLFMLKDDGSATAFAIYFIAYEVADKIEIFYNDSETPLLSAIIGIHLNTDVCNTIPIKMNIGQSKLAFYLPEYNAGDFLRIKVTPSVLETNYNTNWELNMICLYGNVFECDAFTEAMRTFNINTIQLIDNTSACRRELWVTFDSPLQNDSNSNIRKYGDISNCSWNQGIYDIPNGKGGVSLSYTKSANYTVYTQSGFGQYEAANGNINYKKVGNVLTITFSNQTDYDEFKASYDILFATAFLTDWVNDNTNLKYYRYISWFWQTTLIGCGDSYTNRNGSIFIDSDFVFSDAGGIYTLTITLATITNGIISETCNKSYSSAQSIVSNVNFYYNLANFDEDTVCRPVVAFGYAAALNGTINETPITDAHGGFEVLERGGATVPCEMERFSWNPLVPFRYSFFQFYLRCKITDIGDPLNNFEVYTALNEDGELIYPSFTLVYAMEDGVQIYPV